jgi:hypothetical protein
MPQCRFLTALTFVALASGLPQAATAAAEYPVLKNGQWEIAMTGSSGGGAPRTSTLCLDASTQKNMLEMGAGMRKEMCSKMDTRRDGARFYTDAECKMGNSVIKSKAVMTMSGDTAYHTESSATYDPPLLKDLHESKSVIDGKYTGPCRDGMLPGDLITSTGQKINLKDLQQRAGTAAAAKGK